MRCYVESSELFVGSVGTEGSEGAFHRFLQYQASSLSSLPLPDPRSPRFHRSSPSGGHNVGTTVLPTLLLFTKYEQRATSRDQLVYLRSTMVLDGIASMVLYINVMSIKIMTRARSSSHDYQENRYCPSVAPTVRYPWSCLNSYFLLSY
jgi:hypothetical protein